MVGAVLKEMIVCVLSFELVSIYTHMDVELFSNIQSYFRIFKTSPLVSLLVFMKPYPK